MQSIIRGEFVSCVCLNEHTSFRFRRCGFLALIFGTIFLIAIVLPYIVAISRYSMPALLPFISQAGGKPPMAGIFTVPVIIMAFTGVFLFVLLHETINHRNIHNLWKLRIANNISILIALGCCLGGVITISYPVGYTEVPNKFEWVVTVLLEHALGACMVLIGAVVLQFLITFIWFLLPDVSKIEKLFKLGLSIVYILVFFTCVKPLLDHLFEEFGPEPFNIQILKSTTYELPLKFSTSYKISSFCEWIVCILSSVFVFSLFKDMQRVSLVVMLRHRSCFSESLDSKPASR